MYTIALIASFSALLFATSVNPVHGVLTLVLVGLSLASYLLGQGLEFVAFIVVLVYVGAVTVLFIFVVMMVNLRATQCSYIMGDTPFFWLLLSPILIIPTFENVGAITINDLTLSVNVKGNLVEVGSLLYGSDRVENVLYVAGVLFVAMIAAICLSFVESQNYRTQEYYTQIRRNNALFGFRQFKS
jgi:NADH-quinone oxidoreductase subunit J